MENDLNWHFLNVRFSLLSLILISCSVGTWILGLPNQAAAIADNRTASPTTGSASTMDLRSGLLGTLKQPELPPLGATASYLPSDLSIRLVVKLSDRKVYVYQKEQVLISYPIAIGKSGWETPTGTFKVFEKEVNPIFKSFKSGQIVQPGPDNPLGVRWIGIWTDGKTRLGFHGTNEDGLIGQAVSHGCIRMHNQDVVTLFEQVTVGTPVLVQP